MKIFLIKNEEFQTYNSTRFYSGLPLVKSSQSASFGKLLVKTSTISKHSAKISRSELTDMLILSYQFKNNNKQPIHFSSQTSKILRQKLKGNMKAQSGKQLIRKCQDANKSTEHIAIEAIDADEPLREKKTEENTYRTT